MNLTQEDEEIWGMDHRCELESPMIGPQYWIRRERLRQISKEDDRRDVRPGINSVEAA